MRQRKVKNEQARLKALEYLQIKNSRELSGKWREYIKSLNPEFQGKIYLEPGCGRGHFLNQLGINKPQDFFIGVEGRSSVVLRALELTRDNEPGNVMFIPEFIIDMEDFFSEGELAGIYLNFSDPWPKKRHEKRRLTHRDYLVAYSKALETGGFIELKTDSRELFDFTLAQCDILGIEVTKISEDLHSSQYPAKEFLTQYERRFMLLGKPIYYCKMTV